jgi:hypothetical protein
MSLSIDSASLGHRPPGEVIMREARVWKVRADDLRRMAASALEPERERKMLMLADSFEEGESELEVHISKTAPIAPEVD